MIRRPRPSRLKVMALSAAVTLLAANADAAQSDASPNGSPPSDTPETFTAVRGDRTSGWLPPTRSEVLARNGVVATSHPLAAQAGLQILKQGGNAFDAAVATAAVLNVVEPQSAGVGGDVFVIAWVAKEKKLIALNGSGRSPTGATPGHMAERGSAKEMPL